MRPVDIQPIGNELAVKWDDGGEDFIPLEKLRRCCPCAGCKGEVDILGNVYKNPETVLTGKAFELVRIEMVGGYAIQPLWADGHSTGIYSFDYLKRVAGGSSDG
ncbi:MAG: DUF971 domain-containing protein [Verrucomicrobiota bacterium]|jgi:DUF971 family protein